MAGSTSETEMQDIRSGVRGLPRNVWAVSLTSFFMDISSEMVLNLLPLFLAEVLGVRAEIIGVIEGGADWTASFFKLFSGWLSDKARERKWLAVLGYAISALSKPFFYFASTWGMVAGARWADRVGKGVRTAPRDALVADSGQAGAARVGLWVSPGSGYRRSDAGADNRAGDHLVGPA